MERSQSRRHGRVPLVVLVFVLSALVEAGAAAVRRRLVWLAVAVLALVLIPVGLIGLALARPRPETA